MKVGGYPKTHLTNFTIQQSLLDLVSSHWACKALSLILESLEAHLDFAIPLERLDVSTNPFHQNP